MRDLSFQHRATDGLTLNVHAFGPEKGKPRAILQILHGMAEHGARYARLAERFTAEGFVVYAHDHRGHGKSARGEAELGKMGGRNAWDRAIEDVGEINAAIRERHGDLPLVLLGHSMGSFMAQQLMYEAPTMMNAVVLSGSSGSPPPIAQLGRIIAKLEAARLGGDGKSPIIQMMSFEDFNRKFAPNRTDFDWLSRDGEEVDAYVRDPLCGFECSVDTWQGLLGAIDAVTDPAHQARIPRDLPVYVFSGSDDAVGDMGKGVERLLRSYRRIGLRNLASKLYPGGRHEMLNETNRAEVMDDLLEWTLGALELRSRIERAESESAAPSASRRSATKSDRKKSRAAIEKNATKKKATKKKSKTASAKKNAAAKKAAKTGAKKRTAKKATQKSSVDAGAKGDGKKGSKGAPKRKRKTTKTAPPKKKETGGPSEGAR